MEIIKEALSHQLHLALQTERGAISYSHLLASSVSLAAHLRGSSSSQVTPLPPLSSRKPPAGGSPEAGSSASRAENGSPWKVSGLEGIYGNGSGATMGQQLWEEIYSAPRGARVGILATPTPEFVAAVWATWLTGGVAVPLAVSHPPAELMHVLSDAGVSVVAAPPQYGSTLEPLAAKCSARFLSMPPLKAGPNSSVSGPAGTAQEEDGRGSGGVELLAESFAKNVTEITGIAKGDDPALIIYTSGTTGRPKGVLHSHGGLISQAQMLREAWEYVPSDRFLHALPLHHVHGIMNALLSPLLSGSTVELLPKFAATGIWRRWRNSYPSDGPAAPDAVTVMTGVPTMYLRLVQAYEAMPPEEQRASEAAASKLRLMMSGSSACPVPLMERWEEITGHRLLERYGMTEFGMGLSNPLHGERRPGMVGSPLPGVEAKICGEGGEVVAEGELHIRSPGLFKEYWGQPKVTAESFDSEGFFKTGDTVTCDQGSYKILGRTSVDIIKSGGYKLSALEIEATLLENPLIEECAVLGLPDSDYGEALAVVVVLPASVAASADATSDPPLTEASLRAWARSHLAPYKIPRQLKIVDAMPRNAMGKVNKKELRRLFAPVAPAAV